MPWRKSSGAGRCILLLEIVSEEPLMLIDYFLCNLSREDGDGVLPFGLVQDKFGGGNIRVPADRGALAFQDSFRPDHREWDVRVEGVVRNCHTDLNTGPLVSAYERNADK